MGCKKENMAAKISGGADIMNMGLDTKSIGHRNVEFATDFCGSEGFRILSNHTRGTQGRVILLTNHFETFIKTVQNSTTSEVAIEENKLQKEISSRKPAISEYVSGTGIFEIDDKSNEQQMDIELF
jgi:chemotaxis protein CheD